MNPTKHELAVALKEMAERGGITLGDALVLRFAAELLREDLADPDAPTPAIPDGWKAWSGGERPDLPEDTKVDVLFRDGDSNKMGETVKFWQMGHGQNNWLCDFDPGDIVAYRIVE